MGASAYEKLMPNFAAMLSRTAIASTIISDLFRRLLLPHFLLHFTPGSNRGHKPAFLYYVFNKFGKRLGLIGFVFRTFL
jgi:hypothetical protein